MKRKYFAMILCIFTLVVTCGCSETSQSDEKEVYKIGISQFAEHASLDNCREGFLEGLAEEGIVEGENLIVKVNNANAEMNIASQIAQNFVSDQVDLICAIATPSAQAAYNAAMDKNINVIYTAVTNPISAQLADQNGNPVGKVSGTSDKLPVEAQLKMIREILPNAKKIGIIYTTSEANSIDSISNYISLADKYGFEIITAGVTSVSEVSIAASNLLTKVDCLSNLTDNTVVSVLPTILNMANEKNIPVFGSEIEQVKIGCLAAEGLDYRALGKETGKMAAKVLKGEVNIEEMKYQVFEENSLFINQEVAKQLGIEISESMKEKASEVFDEIKK